MKQLRNAWRAFASACQQPHPETFRAAHDLAMAAAIDFLRGAKNDEVEFVKRCVKIEAEISTLMRARPDAAPVLEKARQSLTAKVIQTLQSWHLPQELHDALDAQAPAVRQAIAGDRDALDLVLKSHRALTAIAPGIVRDQRREAGRKAGTAKRVTQQKIKAKETKEIVQDKWRKMWAKGYRKFEAIAIAVATETGLHPSTVRRHAPKKSTLMR